MPRVRMLEPWREGDRDLAPGAEVELGEAPAAALIEAGRAVPASDGPPAREDRMARPPIRRGLG